MTIDRVMVPPYEIYKIPDPGEEEREVLIQQCYDVRIEVFVHEQGFPLDVEIDELRIFLYS